MPPSVVVFDIGGVLVDWHPALAWADTLGPDAAMAFMERVNFMSRNARADAGVRFTYLATDITNVDDAAQFAAYVGHFSKTVADVVPGVWAIVDRLRARGVPLHVITNWSAETWPMALKLHPRLRDSFGVTIVSGVEGVAKPDRRIFELLTTRAGVAAQECVFIDDSLSNVDGARLAGMDAIHFTGAAALETALKNRDLL